MKEEARYTNEGPSLVVCCICSARKGIRSGFAGRVKSFWKKALILSFIGYLVFITQIIHRQIARMNIGYSLLFSRKCKTMTLRVPTRISGQKFSPIFAMTWKVNSISFIRL